jgi:hypothetical protein
VRARQSSGPLAISVVSLTEIAGGMRPPERREVIRLLGSMQRFEVTERVAWRAATLSLWTGIGCLPGQSRRSERERVRLRP